MDMSGPNRSSHSASNATGRFKGLRFLVSTSGSDNRFRVFYDVDVERNEVHILAIGVKEGNRLFIGGEEVKL